MTHNGSEGVARRGGWMKGLMKVLYGGFAILKEWRTTGSLKGYMKGNAMVGRALCGFRSRWIDLVND